MFKFVWDSHQKLWPTHQSFFLPCIYAVIYQPWYSLVWVVSFQTIEMLENKISKYTLIKGLMPVNLKTYFASQKLKNHPWKIEQNNRSWKTRPASNNYKDSKINLHVELGLTAWCRSWPITQQTAGCQLKMLNLEGLH